MYLQDCAPNENDAPWAGLDEPGDATDGQEHSTPCAKNWKASGGDGNKSSFDIYDITGIFPVACRHGLIEAFTEIIQSGEL